MFTRDSTELTDPEMVPPLADRWSHHTGGTHIKVVPSHWRATCRLLRTRDDQPCTSIRRLMRARVRLVRWERDVTGRRLR